MPLVTCVVTRLTDREGGEEEEEEEEEEMYRDCV